MKKRSFMKEWRKNFGKESPIKMFKNSGSLRKRTIINEYSKEVYIINRKEADLTASFFL